MNKKLYQLHNSHTIYNSTDENNTNTNSGNNSQPLSPKKLKNKTELFNNNGQTTSSLNQKKLLINNSKIDWTVSFLFDRFSL
jgi:hypothetical protein